MFGALVLASHAVTGCTVIRYDGPNGERFTRTSFGTKTSLTSLIVDVGTNGVRKVTMRGYSNDQVESLSVIAEGIVAGAIKGVKP